MAIGNFLSALAFILLGPMCFRFFIYYVCDAMVYMCHLKCVVSYGVHM